MLLSFHAKAKKLCKEVVTKFTLWHSYKLVQFLFCCHLCNSFSKFIFSYELEFLMSGLVITKILLLLKIQVAQKLAFKSIYIFCISMQTWMIGMLSSKVCIYIFCFLFLIHLPSNSNFKSLNVQFSSDAPCD